MAADLSPLRATTIATPLGPVTAVVGPRGVLASDLGPFGAVVGPLEDRLDASIVRDDRGLAPVRDDVEAYFEGSGRGLLTEVDLSLVGGSFARRVLEQTVAIPYGELRTYGDVAVAAGSPRAWRAAGVALRRCPIELWVPCHRVVPAGPGLGNYGGHPEVRRSLLELEGSLPEHGSASPGRSLGRTGRWRT